jgi:Concanavalin A-like lectin/glucanases superfamily
MFPVPQAPKNKDEPSACRSGVTGGVDLVLSAPTRRCLDLPGAASILVCLLMSSHVVLAQLTNDAIAHWNFDEGSGATALDSSGNNHTGTIVGAVYVAGQANSALSFNGSNAWVFSSEAVSGGVVGAGLDVGARDWTAAAWIKTTGSGMVVTKMGWIGGANPDGWGMSVSANGTLGAALHESGVGTVNIYAGDGKVVSDGQWHHVAVVFNRVANMIRYVDGAPSGTQNDLTFLGGQIVDNTKQLRIGARDQAGDEVYFKGLIDDVRVYARALSPEDIAALAGVEPPKPPVWSAPISLVPAYGRLALGNRVHVVGHSGGNLVHRSSQDNGAAWSPPFIVCPAAGNYPMQYGGLYAVGDAVYLLTAAGDMGAYSQPLDFRKSTNNGASWSSPIRITRPGQEIRRANIIASGNTVHVFGGQSDPNANGYGTGVFYFRSLSAGLNWDPGILLFAQGDASARMAVDGTTVHVCFGAKETTNSYGGRSTYLRSTDNGTTWSQPLLIGEISAETDVQARQQIAAADGRVIAVWQRERPSTGGALPTARLGYNRSADAGTTWQGLALLPGDQILSTETNIVRDHHQIWMTPGGGVHVAWAHGPPGESSTPLGYIFSPDYGATWTTPEIAITPPGGSLPYGIVADDNWVHILAEPGIYVRRRVPPVFRSVRLEGQTVVLEWTGRGTLQWAQRVSGPWTYLSGATNSPQTVAVDSAQRFFRIGQ